MCRRDARLGCFGIVRAVGTMRKGENGRDDFVDVLYRARSSTMRLRGYLDTRVESMYGYRVQYIRKLARR